MVELSKEEKLGYYKALSQMTGSEKREERRSRYDEMLSEGMKPSEATTILEGEEVESREMLKEEQERMKMGKKPGFEKDYVDKEDDIPDADFIEMKERAQSEEDEYISGLERKERQKEVFEGLVGYGSREPLKEEIVSGAKKILSKTPEATEKILSGIVSGGKKLAEKLKPKEKESRRPSYRPYREEYYRPERREPSLKDLGKGSMGAERYEGVRTPDFFGGGFGEGKSPMGESRRTYRRDVPPSTAIPFGGSRAPDTSIPFGGSQAPSVAFHAERRPPSTRVPSIKEKAPKVTYKGARKVSTRIPKAGKKPVRLQKVGRPISTKIGKPQTPKTRVKVEEDDILGLKNFW